MTLCVAWKQNNQVHFASDSRISFGNGNYTDVAIKVFSVPVRISVPFDIAAERKVSTYDHTIGMCISGSTVNAYIVKESIYEVLQHLQCTYYTDFSMNGIVKLIARFYEHTSRKVCEQMGSKGIAEFFLGGFCPVTRAIKVFEFKIDSSINPISARIREVLQQDGTEMLGSGEAKAKDILLRTPDVSKFALLRQVIHDPEVPTVGGNMQYGTFEDENFIVEGVHDYEIRDRMVHTKFNFRGTELCEGEFSPGLDDFAISYRFIAPFQAEIKNVLNHRE